MPRRLNSDGEVKPHRGGRGRAHLDGACGQQASPVRVRLRCGGPADAPRSCDIAGRRTRDGTGGA